ncbi:MAG TPA: hypothetical protein VKO35_02465, partial [Acidimicrobiia bacterium]|nr:hypothetical protein [Acidimicrobiia bacterium]
MSTTTISWSDLEGLVDALRAAHPRVDPRALDDAELAALVEGLEHYDGSGPAAGPEALKPSRPSTRAPSSASSSARGSTRGWAARRASTRPSRSPQLIVVVVTALPSQEVAVVAVVGRLEAQL